MSNKHPIIQLIEYYHEYEMSLLTSEQPEFAGFMRFLVRKADNRE